MDGTGDPRLSREPLTATLITPDDGERYDEARTLFNSMIDRRPAAIACCESVDDVVACLAAAGRAGVAIAVRAGGHSVAGVSMCDDGLVIDVRRMNDDHRRPGRAHRPCRRRRDLGAVRCGNAGARARHDRRAGLDDRCGRTDARRRLRLARALVRARLRQPDRGRARDRGGRARPRERRRAFRALLGASRRRRQLRCRHGARVPAPRGGPDGLRRARRVRSTTRTGGLRGDARVPRGWRPRRGGPRPAGTSPRRPRSSSRRSGTASWSRSPPGCGTARSTEGERALAPCARSPSRSSTSTARSRTQSSRA